MTAKHQMRSAWRVAASGLVSAVAFSMLMPLAAATLAANRVSFSAVGIFALVPYAVLIVAAPLASRLHAQAGPRASVLLGLTMGLAAALGFALTEGWWAWLAAAAMGGLYLALLWALTDGLIATSAPPEMVGRITGLYQTLLAAALLAGPILPIVLELDFPRAAWTAAALMMAACLPLLGSLPLPVPPGINASRRQGSLSALSAAPTLYVAALLGGLFESGLNAIGAVQAHEFGASVEEAATVAAVIAAGSLLVQYPLGFASDRLGPDRIVKILIAALLVSSSFLPIAGSKREMIWVLGLVWGAAGGGLYTLVLIRIACRFRGAEQATTAAATAVAAYTLGAIIGPGLGGLAMHVSERFGLAALLTASAMVLLIAVHREQALPR